MGSKMSSHNKYRTLDIVLRVSSNNTQVSPVDVRVNQQWQISAVQMLAWKVIAVNLDEVMVSIVVYITKVMPQKVVLGGLRENARERGSHSPQIVHIHFL